MHSVGHFFILGALCNSILLTMRLARLLYLVPLLLLMHCASPQTPAPLQDAPVAISWRVISHLDAPNVFSSALTLTNTSDTAIPASGWTLYFNFIRMIDASTVSDQAKVTHINGDFYKLEPTDAFPALEPGASTEITFESAFWAVKKSDAPGGFYMVFADAAGVDGAPQPVRSYTVADFETPAQTMRSAADLVPVPTALSRFSDNAGLSRIPAADLPPVVPTPVSWEMLEGTFNITSETTIYADAGLDAEVDLLADILHAGLNSTGISRNDVRVNANIRLRINADQIDSQYPGGYTLLASPEALTITGADAAGVFYGIQSLRSMIPVEAFASPVQTIAIPAIRITDAPRFEYRGMHIDVARNFHTKASILKVLDVMGHYKLNKFHFHLTDDEGWRLEIDGLPELTEIGSRRGHTLDEMDHLYPSLGSGPNPDNSNGSGHYTRGDFIEILRYAAARHIEVIPEIDVPGHARAAIRAMEARYHRLAAEGDPDAGAYRLTHPDDTSTYASVQLWNDNVIDVCQPSTYAFLEKVVDDVVKMYEEADVPLETVHIGNDEVPQGAWLGSPACQALETTAYNAHFLEKMHAILSTRGLNLAGWEEIALTADTAHGSGAKVTNTAFVDSNFRPYVWNAVWGWGAEGTAYALANAGYKIVLSNATNLYFDFAYDKDPEEPGFYWAGFSDTKKAFVFNPMDLYQNAEMSLFGQPLDAANVYKDFPRLTEAGRQNILGIQGQLWSESAKGAAVFEYQLFPKLIGLAERAWAPAPAWTSIGNASQRSAAEAAGWNVIANQIGQRELPRMDAVWNLGYRIPPPGLRMNGTDAEANVAFPGLTLRYTTEPRAPLASDPEYTGPVAFEGELNVAAFSSTGRASRTASLGTAGVRN